MKCRCGIEAEMLFEREIQVPADMAGSLLRCWRCPVCAEQFHSIEGPLGAGGMMRTVNEHEAAAILGKSVYTLRNERAQRRSSVPYVRQGRKIGYLLCDLAEHLMAHRVLK